MKKLYRFLVLTLPIVLYFSYFPVISLGSSETMNFELSLPLIWLVVFDVVASVMMIREKKCGKILKKWWWWVFPIFVTISLVWSANVVRGVLTVGILWLVYIAVCAFVVLKETAYDVEFKKKWWRVFFIAAIVACAWCVAQCIMDALGVPRENSLMCAGCVSEMFGFPHPNGFAIEPQFMGNLLLAPAIVAGWMLLKRQNTNNPKRERSRGDNFYNKSVGTHTKLQFRDLLRDCCKNHSGSRSLCFGLLALCFFVIVSTLFLTFSRGAIYAFIVAMIFLTIAMNSKYLSRDTRRFAPASQGAFKAVRPFGSSASQGAVRPSLRSRDKYFRALQLWGIIVVSFLFALNFQGILAEVGPTNDTYTSGVSKVINHLSLGIIDFRGEKTEEFSEESYALATELTEEKSQDAVFDGYVEESTNTRVKLTEAAMKVWTSDFKTVMVGVGIGGAGQAMFDAGETDSPKEIVQNEYASLLVEVGAIGVALAIFTVVMAARWIIKNGGSSSSLLLTVMLAYAVTLMFFSGFANALQIYLLPAVLVVMLV